MKITSLIGILSVAVLANGTSYANSVGTRDPRYVRVKVYEIRVSQNDDCSASVLVSRNASPVFQDFVNNPTLGTGAVPNGTYRCVMMRISDQVHFTPSSLDPGWTHAACAVGTDYSGDVAHDDDAIDPDGTTQALGAPGTENIVWLYIRTGGGRSNDGNQHAFQPTGGIPLTSPLEVHGDTEHTMVFNFTSAVGEEFNGSAYECSLDAPTLSFR